MVIAIDLFHTGQWFVGPVEKRDHGPRPQFSDLGCLGHWAAMAQAMGAEWRVLDEAWSAESLRDVDLLLLPLPEHAEDTPLSDAENALVADHLQAGGGLLLFSSAEQGPGWPGVVIPGSPKLCVGARIAGEPQLLRPHVLDDEIEVALGDAHSVVEGVGLVHFYRAREMDGAATGLQPVVEIGDKTAVLCGEVHGGRVAAVGNAEMFTAPFIGCHDNGRLLANLMTWLATGEVDAETAARATHTATHTYRSRPRILPEPGDLALRTGSHLIDAAVFGRDVERVTADGTLHPYEEPELFLREAELRYAELPRPVRRAVSDFKRESNDYGVLLVRGLPVRTPPPTPADPTAIVPKDTWHSEFWLAAFGQALGSAFSYAQEKQGVLFQNVVPTAHNADKLSSESSSILLDYHTEAAFHPFKPDFVMLYCLRPDHDRTAKTISASVRMILPLLSARERHVLAQPLFRTGIDYTFGSANGTRGNGPVLSVLTGDPFDPELTYDLDLMVGETPEAEHTLQALRRAASAVGCWAQLDQGDLLIVDNRRAVHARSEFTPRYDGEDRWLQRTCVAVDISMSSAYRRAGSHVIETTFSV